ncbi:MAG: hypothetical protein E7L00_11260 [Propionibacteriaceae bacterium]|nr:hypothetical protein [Propionibacteriaceae bacterium]
MKRHGHLDAQLSTHPFSEVPQRTGPSGSTDPSELKPARIVVLGIIASIWVIALITQISLTRSRLLEATGWSAPAWAWSVLIWGAVLAVGAATLWWTRRWPWVLLVPLHALLLYFAIVSPWGW